MAIFKSISSISNVKVSMRSSLVANPSSSGVFILGGEGTSCFGGGFDGGFNGGFNGGCGSNSNINIIDLDLNFCGRRRRCC